MAREAWNKTARAIRREMFWDNLGMIAGSVSFIAALGCVFGVSFMLTISFFIRHNETRTAVAEPVPAQVEKEHEPGDFEPVDETKERGGLRFVPAVYTRYDDDEAEESY